MNVIQVRSGDISFEVVSSYDGPEELILKLYLFGWFALWLRYIKGEYKSVTDVNVSQIIPVESIQILRDLTEKYNFVVLPFSAKLYILVTEILPTLPDTEEGTRIFTGVVNLIRYLGYGYPVCSMCDRELGTFDKISGFYYEEFLMSIPYEDVPLPPLKRMKGVYTSLSDAVLCDRCQNFVSGIGEEVEGKINNIVLSYNFHALLSEVQKEVSL